VHDLNSVQVELGTDACGVVSCFRDEFIGRADAEREKGGEIGNGGCVRGTCAAHDDGENIDDGAWPVVDLGSIGLGSVVVANQLCCVGRPPVAQRRRPRSGVRSPTHRHPFTSPW
jgi:hypothetical protein